MSSATIRRQPPVLVSISQTANVDHNELFCLNPSVTFCPHIGGAANQIPYFELNHLN
jgi:hypothetical protein